MTNDLWSWNELIQASGGIGDASNNASSASDSSIAISGISIDSRTLEHGDLFVALQDQRDGHEFVSNAFRAGAGAALVSKAYVRRPGDGLLLRVDDTFHGLQNIARAARQRLAKDALVIAVTGSVGKTGTKEMLRAALSSLGKTHAAERSYNNHWGVPLTLARMPRDVNFAVFEIGMNHAGEITPLTKMVSPDVAIVTTVEPVHLEFFASVDEIAEAKAEIFHGLRKGGWAVINRDNRFHDVLAERATSVGAQVVTFGHNEMSNVRGIKITPTANGSTIDVASDGASYSFDVSIPGRHVAQNALAVFATLNVLGVDLNAALAGLTKLEATPGRGARERLTLADGAILLIDESYNANPASMRAALTTLAAIPNDMSKRKIAVLGEMLELGETSSALHKDLAKTILDFGIDLVFASGPNMQELFASLPSEHQGAWAAQSSDLIRPLFDAITDGDAVMVKGSLGSNMAVVVGALKDADST